MGAVGFIQDHFVIAVLKSSDLIVKINLVDHYTIFSFGPSYCSVGLQSILNLTGQPKVITKVTLAGSALNFDPNFVMVARADFKFAANFDPNSVMATQTKIALNFDPNSVMVVRADFDFATDFD